MLCTSRRIITYQTHPRVACHKSKPLLAYMLSSGAGICLVKPDLVPTAPRFVYMVLPSSRSLDPGGVRPPPPWDAMGMTMRIMTTSRAPYPPHHVHSFPLSAQIKSRHYKYERSDCSSGARPEWRRLNSGNCERPRSAVLTSNRICMDVTEVRSRLSRLRTTARPLSEFRARNAVPSLRGPRRHPLADCPPARLRRSACILRDGRSRILPTSSHRSTLLLTPTPYRTGPGRLQKDLAHERERGCRRQESSDKAAPPLSAFTYLTK
ncbi:hypothetical protein EDB80DRAFT_122672 [Ilyonectria destructans]|nr:hypothetical protein EDB80DRAFT_122672 [Ilyonectria destructans]